MLDAIPRLGRAQIVLLAVVCFSLGAFITLSTQHLRGGVAPLATDEPAFRDLAKPRKDDWWTKLHDRNVDLIDAADKADGFKVIFYGDSITEAYEGTRRGQRWPELKGVEELFNKTWSDDRVRGVALGIAGDTTSNLLWRLKHGELPKKAPKVIVLQIGTNDLTAVRMKGKTDPFAIHEKLAAAVSGITIRIWVMIHHLRHYYPNTFIVLHSVLPRGGDQPVTFEQPSIYTSAVDLINAHMAALSFEDTYVEFSDCGDRLLLPNGNLDPEMIPDGLHPSEAGYKRISTCLEILIGRLIESPPVAIVDQAPM